MGRKLKRLLSLLLATLLLPAVGGVAGPAAGASSADKTVGVDIAFGDIEDLYYTYDASTAPPHYLQYRFHNGEDGRFFYHESREGGGWPQTEEDIVASGTVELSDEQWTAFCDLLRGGTAKVRSESLDDGDAGPWLSIYWTDGETEGREFFFEPPGKLLAFEEFCIGLKESQAMKIRVSDGTNTIVYQLNDSPSARSLYGMLPLEAEVENYGGNEKIFYPERKIDASDGIEGGGGAGGLALFSPWGNVVMYYGDFGAYPGLYILGEAVEGAEQVRDLSGIIRVEAAE